MRATELLIEEHRTIERVLVALNRVAERLNRGEEVYLRFFIGTSVFIDRFVDQYHQKKEEAVLFPAMIKGGLPLSRNPFEIILAEHEQTRFLSKIIRQTAESLQLGNMRARAELVTSSFRFIQLVRQHTYREEHILYAISDRLIPLERQGPLLEAFEQYKYEQSGDDVQEKYHGLADRLVRESMR